MVEQCDQEGIAIKRISRRRLLAGACVGAVGLLVAAGCGDDDNPPTPDGCPAETVSPIPGTTSGGDPVNLVFHASTASPVHQSFAGEVKSILRNVNDDPWTSPGLAHFQLPAVNDYTCRSGDAAREDEQAVKPIDWRSRYHLRLWNFDGAAAAIGSAHAETVSLNFTHKVTSFDGAKHEVALALRVVGWTVQKDSLRLRQYSSAKDNGKATELTR